MERFVSYEKMSKKQQKIFNASKRGNWGNVKPITKVKASAKFIIVRRSRTPGTMAIVSGVLLFYKAGKCYEQELKRMGKIFSAGAAT